MSNPIPVSSAGAMSVPTSTLDDCGCCEGLTSETPVAIVNRPGLDAIAYRIGIHSQFLASMLAGLSTSQLPALRDLHTREGDDLSIALLDAWAMVADILTFYQERIANESYLRTATERLSVLQLARLIGYELRPGVAASAYLAFTVQDSPGTPPQTSIDAGTQVQSIPGPGEQPQTFETIAAAQVRSDWNDIRVRTTQPQILSRDMSSILLSGAVTNLNSGDSLLIAVPAGDGAGVSTALRRVVSAVPDADTGQTSVTLEPQPPVEVEIVPPFLYRPPIVSAAPPPSFTERIPLNDTTAWDIVGSRTWNARALRAFADVQRWNLGDIKENLTVLRSRMSVSPPGELGIFAFGANASLFGYNAPDWKTMPDAVHSAYSPAGTVATDWPVHQAPHQLDLDQVYGGILRSSWIAITGPSLGATITTVKDQRQTSRSEYALSNKITQIDLYDDATVELSSFDDLRKVAILVDSQKLSLADTPIDTPVSGRSVELDNLYFDLNPGQTIILTGERVDLSGVVSSEAAVLADVLHTAGYTTLNLVADLLHQYQRSTVTINGNVVLATHGETVTEVLGSGDSSQSFQRFSLRQTPLTHIHAPSATGVESTLRVYVDDVQWSEVPALFGHGPRERVFVTRTGEDGTTTVEFGDGITGARLPTGNENVRAIYRKGLGIDGLVQAGQLKLLMTRPLGVSGVTNPEAAAGADDRESLADARQNAPLTVLTLDRVVSLQDYEDFARAFAGVAKALATWTWDGQKRSVVITVAGPNGADIPADSDLYANLLAAMRGAGDPHVPIRLQSYVRAFFHLAASVQVDPNHQTDLVLAAVEAALRSSFSFDARSFGQSVMLSDVLAVLQSVPGVLAADVNLLYRSGDPPSLQTFLPAALLQASVNAPAPAAELLILDPGPLDALKAMI